MVDTVIFLSLCFFTLGFLCLIGVISFSLNYYFTSKVYQFYFGYILATALFIACVFVIHIKLISPETTIYKIALFIYEPLQVVIFLLYTFFIYNAMLPESKGLDKYQKLLNWYAVISVCYILFSLIFPALSKSGSRPNVILYATVRIIIVSVSFVFYIQLMKNLSNIYFRYLFAGCSLLLVFALLALWDSTVNRENSNLKGFQFISIGYVLENLCFSAAFVYRIITVYREKQASEILYQKQLAFVQAESQQQTMKHIGTEIHDNVGQKLTLASLYTKQLAAGTIRNMENKITEVSNIIDESLTELRQLSKTLTNSDLANANLLMLLNEEARRINSSGICYISIDSHGGEFILPQTEKNILFRLLQEFIQNSLKHARCRKMDIILQKENEQLNITATDDGKGFDTTITSTGIGLQNMKRRAEQLNAIYQLNSEIGKGTSLTLQLSLAR